MTVPSVPLNTGASIPQLGLGTARVTDQDQIRRIVGEAFEIGYRHVDTAAAYDNEVGVGRGIAESRLPRDQVFVTTKLRGAQQGAETRAALEQSLERLGLGYVDLYLIHWPVPQHDRYVDTWRAFIELQEEGLARSIGVSNFQPAHLHRIIEETGVTPAVNQVELHPRFQQAGLRREHAELGIVTEAWSPLAQGAVLDEAVIEEIATDHERTPGQVVLRWHLQLGNVVFPKSVTPDRIEENFDVFGFHLTDGDMEAIEALDAGERQGPDPDAFVRP